MEDLVEKIRIDKTKLRVVDFHVVFDCCPRNGNAEPPSSDTRVVHAYRLEESALTDRARHTLYMNIPAVNYIIEEKGCMDIRCPQCRRAYFFLDEDLDYALEHGTGLSDARKTA